MNKVCPKCKQLTNKAAVQCLCGFVFDPNKNYTKLPVPLWAWLLAIFLTISSVPYVVQSIKDQRLGPIHAAIRRKLESTGEICPPDQLLINKTDNGYLEVKGSLKHSNRPYYFLDSTLYFNCLVTYEYFTSKVEIKDCTVNGW